MKRYGLIGRPLGHSFSAGYFAAKFRREGITGCDYALYELPSIEALPELLGTQPELQGFNVTIPYKQRIFDYLDDVSEEAARIGAVNCVRRDGGRLTGFNTDIEGVRLSLRLLLGDDPVSYTHLKVIMQKPSIPKGTRDFSPAEMMRRNYIFDSIRQVFRTFGFAPLETPAMENLSTLLGKYGDEGDKLLFKILNSGDYAAGLAPDELRQASKICEKGLRYDLTVPFARYVVQHQGEIVLPLSLIHI